MPDDEVRYFSNGEEGRAWMRRWCDRCIHDHSMHKPDVSNDDIDRACLHVAHLYVGVFDPVFIADGAWTCVEFARCSCDGGPDDPGVPPPPPVDENQGMLFDADRLMPGVPRGVYLDELAAVTSR